MATTLGNTEKSTRNVLACERHSGQFHSSYIQRSHSANPSKQNSGSVKNYRIGVYLLTAIMLLCACAEMSAQTFAKIKVQQDGLIKLPAESQIQETYLLDISDLRFTSEEEAISYLSDKSSPYYYLRSRGNTSEAVMVVRIGEHPNLTKTQWIESIKKASTEKPLKK